ncbi:hypothetical protein EZV62_001908 [Acer yangbiense]|uniref:Pentatricopeptide repeat-containing protein n=1 Tax=Acer yangbiense TaxID=1000413 RepID=A0A5C7IW74_9ROSI|nr:hypothetical protein EZV62_001908 [Acer yangbiense]
MIERNVVSWTAMVNEYSRFGLDDEAFRLFSDSIAYGIRANAKMFVCVINLCSHSAFCAFDGMSERDMVSWATMITALNKSEEKRLFQCSHKC